jgi:hypothetical protein
MGHHPFERCRARARGLRTQGPARHADHEPSASTPSLFDPSYGANSQSTTPKGQKKPFVLDPLLNSN